MTKAIVVLSGGQDSTISLFQALQDGADVLAITFGYGQRQYREIAAAMAVANYAGVLHYVINLDPDLLVSTSPLIEWDKPLATYENVVQMKDAVGATIEATFVPMRNALFLTIAANRAAAVGAERIYIGVCEEDTANYPDCTQRFVDCQNDVINVALGRDELFGNANAPEPAPVFITTPLMKLSKADAIKLALTMDGCYTALGLTHTAYSNEYPPRTQDHATVLRAAGFAAAGIPDPLIVRAWWEGLCDLPAADNYSKWQEAGVLRHVGLMANHFDTGPYIAIMRPVENAIRSAIGGITSAGRPARAADPIEPQTSPAQVAALIEAVAVDNTLENSPPQPADDPPSGSGTEMPAAAENGGQPTDPA